MYGVVNDYKIENSFRIISMYIPYGWIPIKSYRVNIKINRQLNDLPAKTGHVTRKKLTSCHNKKLIHIFLMFFPYHPQPNMKP